MRSLRLVVIRIGLGVICFAIPAMALRGADEEEKDAPPPAAKDKPVKGGDEKKSAAGKGSEKTAAEKKAADKKSEKAAAAKAAEEADIQYVKEGLKQYLHGALSFNEKNMVTIDYDFTLKKEEFEKDFTPSINPAFPSASPFRWSRGEEEWSYSGVSSGGRTSSNSSGLRISDGGAAFLNLWFKDEVEATMEYWNGIGWTKRQICAVVFQAKNGQAIGNNFGGQCALFSGGGLKGGVPPATETLLAERHARFGLKVKDGTFEALLNGKSKKTSKYSPRSYSPGRIGFVWGGNLAGTITSVTITGMIDFTAAAKEMRKAKPK